MTVALHQLEDAAQRDGLVFPRTAKAMRSGSALMMLTQSPWRAAAATTLRVETRARPRGCEPTLSARLKKIQLLEECAGGWAWDYYRRLHGRRGQRRARRLSRAYGRGAESSRCRCAARIGCVHLIIPPRFQVAMDTAQPVPTDSRRRLQRWRLTANAPQLRRRRSRPMSRPTTPMQRREPRGDQAARESRD